METQNPHLSVFAPPPEAQRQSLWRRIGGFSLSTAIIFHVLLLIGGALWVFTIQVPQKNPDIPIPGSNKGSDSASKRSVSVRTRVPVVKLNDLPRVVVNDLPKIAALKRVWPDLYRDQPVLLAQD